MYQFGKYWVSSPVGPCNMVRALPLRCLTLTSDCRMPYKPEERPPLTEEQKRIYPQVQQEFTEEGYPVLKLFPSGRHIFENKPKYKRREPRFNYAIREEHMKEDQDWPSVWPCAKTFVPSAVPLPLRQSYEEKTDSVPRGKYVNTELQKIANFLHLTPPAIERHCKALKKFCVDWPEGLDTDEDVRSHFPVTYVTSDYVHSSPTIRDMEARIVRLRVKITDLNLDHRSEDKLKRLADHRYDKETDILTITTSACPTKTQNQDYADYLLTALYFESKNHEKWEDDKPEYDWERFFWEKSESKLKFKTYSKCSESIDDELIEKGEGHPVLEEYKKSLENIFDHECYDSLEAYRMSVEKLLNIKQQPVSQ